MYEFIILGASVLISVGILMKITPARGVVQLNADELRDLLASSEKDDIQFIDVRKPYKYVQGHIPHFHNIPLKNIRKAAKQLNASKKTIVTCQTGAKGNEACKRLKRRGFKKIYNLQGGLSNWDPMKRVK